jgi:predicted methyltransferase
MKNIFLISAAMILIAACDSKPEAKKNDSENAANKQEAAAILPSIHPTSSSVVKAAGSVSLANKQSDSKLMGILSKQPESVQKRFEARHPQQTIEFFGLKPGMTVVEALPGGGWYSKILMPYLGQEGRLIGVDYSTNLYPLFGFFKPEDLEKKKTWVADWSKEANQWRKDNWSSVAAFQFGDLPAEMHSTADAVLFIRALHNLARFENKGQFLTAAIQNTYDVLKPGGIVGIVQHQAPESANDAWANGDNGYLKKSFVIKVMQEAGFELVGQSAINENSADKPTDKDFVWRLPPTYASSRDNPELKAQYTAVGESNRMTLKFIKR